MTGPRASLSVDDASSIIDRRFPGDDELADELSPMGPLYTPQREPWRSLRLVNPRVDRVLREYEARTELGQQRQEQMRTHFASLSIPDLLTAVVDRPTERAATLVIEQGITPADLDLLLRIAQEGNRWQRFVALRGLACFAHPAALQFLRAFFQLPPSDALWHLYGAAIHAITALPAALTLDLARAWFDAADDSLHHVALQILRVHATVADVPRIRNALLPSLQRDTPNTNECYMQCDMLEILARFPAAGPFPEAEIIYHEAGYSLARLYAVQALAAVDQEQFADSLVLECLWDCEDETRRFACEKVSPALAGALARLQVLASDPYEGEQIRSTAKTRLSALKSLPTSR